MEFTASPKPQLSSRANAFSIAALMSSGGSKEKEAAENTIKPLGESGFLAVRRGQGAGKLCPSCPAGLWLRVAACRCSLVALLTLGRWPCVASCMYYSLRV